MSCLPSLLLETRKLVILMIEQFKNLKPQITEKHKYYNKKDIQTKTKQKTK